ncbi:MAG: aminodeoxychorismate synthase component I [Desulfofustis sp.]|nr:aminodeoxychorismate synthase component I [Desulfofustis sp.]
MSIRHMTPRTLHDKEISGLFSTLGDQRDFVYLDTSMVDRTNYRSLLFTEPVERLCLQAGEDRPAFLEKAAQWLDRGYHIAGWLGYELLHDELAIGLKNDATTLADLGVYGTPMSFDHRNGDNDFPPINDPGDFDSTYRLTNLHPTIEEDQYCRAIERILEYIAAGDTYQVNYTFKLHFDFDGSPASFYRDLRRSQPVPYGCFMKHGDSHILSFSPELFFRLDSGKIIARPMKGTMKRGRFNGEDKIIARTLNRDVKNRSENVMIVDLLRNDLSHLVDNTGGGVVEVESLFDVERYRTVFQMTSTIVATRLGSDRIRPARILEAIFPCGSVTGAPKIRTMEIIDELEFESRGVYTGAIGYFSPDGEAAFNVPIRTVVIHGRRGEMGIGSGIVSDSSPIDEWRECLLKARFLTNPPPPFALLETLLFDPREGYLYLDEHLDRLATSADYLGRVCDLQQVRIKLDEFGRTFSGSTCMRVRLLVADDGGVSIEVEECERALALSIREARALSAQPRAEVNFADQVTDSASPWLFHKTTRRELYDNAWRQASSEGLYDLIFCNQKGEVTEGAISNIIVEADGCFFTPPLECGLLPGVMRARLLAAEGECAIEERVLYKDDLQRADRIYLCNSVRGVVEVELRRS